MATLPGQEEQGQCCSVPRTVLPSPVPVVHCGMPNDVLLVHAGVIALLAFVGLAAHMVEHVLLQEADQGHET